MSSTIAKQGMISILGSEGDQIAQQAASLRRTLSADMSSKQWLAQNGFPNSSMKRIASSKELKEHDEELSQADIWASILSQKASTEENLTLPPPYVHPLVKRTNSSLSEKSLEICTESLGSETGSDGFSMSETGETEEDHKDVTQVVTQSQPQQEKDWQPFNLEKSQFIKSCNFSTTTTTKKSHPKSFPPPLPSLAQRDGPSLQMQPRREDGRLVLEAVSIPSQNCFSAQRQDGRLLLTLDLEEVVNEEEEVDEVEHEEVFNNFEREGEEEEEDDENEDEALGFVMDQVPNYSREVISVHRSALMMKRLVGLNNSDPKWNEKLKKVVNLVEMSQSLTQPPMMARLIESQPVAASFNSCDYFWRTKPSMESTSPLKVNTYNITSPKLNQNEEMVLMKGIKGDYLVPSVKNCKGNKNNSLLFWKPYCIATS